METNKKNSRPAHTVRHGMVRATVWPQQGEKGAWFNVIVDRGYRDKEGAWQKTNYLTREDLLPAARALEHAYDWIVTKQTEDKV